MEQVEIVDAATAIKAGGGAFRIAEKDYHADPCPSPSLSSSIGKKLINETPSHAKTAHPKLNPDWQRDGGSRRTALGSACHCLLSGADRASIVEIEYDNYKKNAAKEERDEAINNGQTPVLTCDLERAEIIVDAAREQLRGSGLGAYAGGNGDAEVVVAHETVGGWKRIKMDWWSADRTTIIDYKTIGGSASPEAFAKRAAQMDYDFQDAFYLFVVGETFPFLAGRMSFIFVVQEIDPPYALAWREITEYDRTIAWRKVVYATSLWFKCLESGKWPGYRSGVERFSMPVWHQTRWLEREMGEEDAT